MITRFVPVGYQPQWTNEPIVDKVKRAVAGLGDLIDDYEFHYPYEINEDNVEAVKGALGGHALYCVAPRPHPPPNIGPPRLGSPAAPPPPGDGRRPPAPVPTGRHAPAHFTPPPRIPTA